MVEALIQRSTGIVCEVRPAGANWTGVERAGAGLAVAELDDPAVEAVLGDGRLVIQPYRRVNQTTGAATNAAVPDPANLAASYAAADLVEVTEWPE